MILRARAAFLLTLLLGALALGWPAAARAHGVLRRSAPAANARLTVAPREVRLTFNERVELPVTHIDLTGPDGRAVALSPVRHGHSASVVLTDVTGALAAGSYTVAWQIAGRDGHPVRGTFRFTIAEGASGLAAADPVLAADTSAAAADHSAHADTSADTSADVRAPAPDAFDAESPAYAAVRWLGFASLLALVGSAGFGLLVLPGARRAALSPALVPLMESRARALGLASAALLLVACVLRLAAQAAAMHGVSNAPEASLLAPMLVGTTWGTGWLLQTFAAAVALVALALARPARAWPVVGVGVSLAVVGGALSGHAAAMERALPLAVALHSLHALAAGAWLGTLLVLALAGVSVATRAVPAERGPAAAALVGAFSPWALAFAGLVVVTGAASAWLHLPSVGALWSTGYGRMLVGKLALLAPVLAAGAYNWLRVRPSLGDSRSVARLTRTSTFELAFGALVLAVTAVLVATPPDAP